MVYQGGPRDIAPIQQAARRLGPGGLAAVVADIYGVGTEDVLGRSAGREAGAARMMLYYVLYTYLYWKTSAIARRVGRDTSSVNHGRLKVARALGTQSEVAYALRCIEQEIVLRAARPRPLREAS